MSSIVELHKQLVEIDSTEDVDEIRKHIIEFLNSNGENPEIDEAGNIIATKGEGSPHYVLNTHFDTVPPHIPYEKDGNKINGRGTSDAKGPLSIFLHAFKNIDLEYGKLTLALTYDEETDMTGAEHLSDTLENVNGFIIGEPTELDVCISSKGYYEGEIHVTGEAAHSSTPEDGINSISVAGHISNILNEYDAHIGNESHPELGDPILEPTLIEGGEAINQIPEKCVVQFSRRGVPPEGEKEFTRGLQSYLDDRIYSDSEISLESKDLSFLAPFETDTESEIVQSLLKSGARKPRAFTAATEASLFASFDVPIAIFGPGYISDPDGAVAHSKREYVPEDQLEESLGILEDSISELFGS